MTFIIGQRWISSTESQLGLGIITNFQGRQVHVSFPAASEERIYATDNAPLSRIIFKEGDEIFSLDQQKISVTAVSEENGLLAYTGLDDSEQEIVINELDLDCFIKLTTPKQRILSGQFDKFESFKLRIDTLNHLSKLQQSPVRGLLGSRTNHLAHQVYIAQEVAKRYAPRVLLADEVGLGKTIEAGMILHYQLHTGRAERILVVVPNSLIHQWLVEMMRRFNLYFSIVDQNSYDNEDEEEFAAEVIEENPFEGRQLVLCSLDFLMDNDKARQQAIDADWDLLVVDEAHHLHWSEDAPSKEYQCIERLAAKTKGLLELTATPEQVGIESHFARLRLLDPSRFYDFSDFQKEEAGYKTLNNLVQELIHTRHESQSDELNDALKAKLKPYISSKSTHSISETIRQLLDRHGTGRVLFRNTRAAIQGFPGRKLHSYPLPKPAIYESNFILYPETKVASELWIKNDPRVAWLSNKLKELNPEKVLVICAKANTAMSLEQHLKLNEGIRCTAFHEGLSIIEGDRSAAYFSEPKNGAQAMICSEIGSEGRNFQFAHHLVLFDLPLNPDLLEQRIGRLDRIGQRHCIEIHVPYLTDTAQERLFRWYQEGINLFEKSCSVGFTIYETFEERLLPLLADMDKAAFASLLVDTRSFYEQLISLMQEGRDRLLELNSCDNLVAEELIATIESTENSMELEDYMAGVFQEYGIEHEFHSECAEILRPTAHMKTSHFPGLKEDGMTVTYSRSKALVREDMEFLSWEHPMVCESMEMIIGSELGNASLVTISVKGLMPGTLLLESFYTLSCAAPKYLQLDRFLPLIPIRILTELSGKDLSKVLSYAQFNNLSKPLSHHKGLAIIKKIAKEIDQMVDQGKVIAELQEQEIRENAINTMKASLGEEVSRLEALQKINPAIRDEEINFFKEQISASEKFINHAALKLQAVRLAVSQ